MSKPFPYAERARAVNTAQATLHEAFAARRFDDPASIERWKRAADVFHASLGMAFAPGFWDDLARVRAGDATGLDTLIGFLEADPMFFGSGYAKGEVVQAIKRCPLTSRQATRIRQVLVNLVMRRDDREFRKFCRLASKVETPAFLDELQALAISDDPAVARRARWMQDALRS